MGIGDPLQPGGRKAGKPRVRLGWPADWGCPKDAMAREPKQGCDWFAPGHPRVRSRGKFGYTKWSCRIRAEFPFDAAASVSAGPVSETSKNNYKEQLQRQARRRCRLDNERGATFRTIRKTRGWERRNKPVAVDLTTDNSASPGVPETKTECDYWLATDFIVRNWLDRGGSRTVNQVNIPG